MEFIAILCNVCFSFNLHVKVYICKCKTAAIWFCLPGHDDGVCVCVRGGVVEYTNQTCGRQS